MKNEFGPLCAHGCGERTRGGAFRPGHDAKLISNLKMEISLAWAEHVQRTNRASQHADFTRLTRAHNDPQFKDALRAAFAQIPAEQTKLATKLAAWITTHHNWDEYLTNQIKRGN